MPKGPRSEEQLNLNQKIEFTVIRENNQNYIKVQNLTSILFAYKKNHVVVEKLNANITKGIEKITKSVDYLHKKWLKIDFIL